MTKEYPKAKILIVEDESVNAKLLESRVRKFGYIPIGPAQTGDAAIKLAIAENPDLVLMDIQLQGAMDGIEAAKIIKENIHTQIVYITAHSEEEFLERAKPTIPQGYILKPFQDKELRITIEMALYAGKLDAERRKAEEALQESERKYRSLFENMMQEVHFWKLVRDERGTIKTWRLVDANPTALNAWGKDRPEALDKTADEIFSYDATKHFMPIVDKIFSEGKPHTWESYFPATDQTLFMTSVPFGEYFISTGTDITERKQAEEKLRYFERRNQALLDYSPVCHKIIDIDFNLQYMSANGFKMLKLEPDADIYGKPYPFYFFPNSFKNEMINCLKKVKETNESITMEALTNDIEGNKVWLDSAIIPVFDDGGNIEYLTVVSADTTGRKKDEEEKTKLQADLRQAQKMEAVGTLAGGIAHDFNNLLQSIIGHTQLVMMDKTENNPEYENLKEIHKSSNRASGLIRQLLLFSRKGDVVCKPVELNHEVENVRRILEHTIPKMVNIEVHPGGRLCSVLADPVQIEQILLNLGTNAADAMPDGGRLVFETENMTIDDEYCQNHLGVQPGNYVLLTVSDTGEGINEEIKEKIFEPFFTTKEFGKGTGLGLASVYGIVKAHGGYIMCYSEVGMGTTFKIYLPAMEEPKAEPESRIFDERPKGGTETILLVDDESSIRDFASQVLFKFGYSPLTATSGEEALEIYSNRRDEINLVVIDLGMPGMGGHKCVQELLKINPGIKVIIASGYSVNGQVKDTLEAGAKGFVGKPYQIHELLGQVRDVLDSEE